MTGRPARRGLVAAAGARLGYAALTRRPPGGEKTWSRTNHRGEPVTLLAGPAVVAGAASAVIVGGLTGRERLALALAGLGAGAVGCYDDLAGSGDRRGFRGHLGALANDEVTSGAIKLAGIGVAGLAAALLLDGAEPGRQGGPGRALDVAINAGLVAGSANLINLFDLRPGRAIKVTLLAGGALAASAARSRSAAAAPVGAALALLPADLGERAMLGDAGANGLGAMLGVAATALPRPARVAVLVAIGGLTAASERVSFTKVIERTPALRRLDMLGRRPPAPPRTEPDASPEGGTPLEAAGPGSAGDSRRP